MYTKNISIYLCMLYAIVDIETTGSHPTVSGITEIAVLIHDGCKVIENYTTLINPLKYIPPYITALTGIDEEMIANAPKFTEVAEKIYKLLENKIFVAHNVNFDYSFVKHYLSLEGYDLNCKKLCTVRLSRKLIPNLPSYSLGKLCGHLNISIHDRHRATGDANATSILFSLLLEKDTTDIVSSMLKKGSKEQNLPSNLNKTAIENLPTIPGVYYFKNQKGKVIYVGKAINIQKRVLSHFTGHNPSKQRQDFIKNVFTIDYKSCGTELMALILEVAEIKKLWPENNKALKKFEHKYGIYDFEDQNGYIRLGIDKISKNIKPIKSFNNLLDGYNFLSRLQEKHKLCPKLCCLQKAVAACHNHAGSTCDGACIGAITTEIYNQRINQALTEITDASLSFAIIDKGRVPSENSCLLIENGNFYGMGYVSDTDQSCKDLAYLKDQLQPIASSNYILNLIYSYAVKNPSKIHSFKDSINWIEPNFL